MALQSDIKTAINMDMPNDENRKLAPTKSEVNCNIKPLITILNKPRVITVIGNDNIIKIGFTAAFRSANTRLAKSATQTLDT